MRQRVASSVLDAIDSARLLLDVATVNVDDASIAIEPNVANVSTSNNCLGIDVFGPKSPK